MKENIQPEARSGWVIQFLKNPKMLLAWEDSESWKDEGPGTVVGHISLASVFPSAADAINKAREHYCDCDFNIHLIQ